MLDHPARVAEEVWVATAMLQLENPDREDFGLAEIVERAQRLILTGAPSLRPELRAHVTQHCVATKAPSPHRYRMLVETGRGRRRLFLPTDRCHPGRRAGKSVPHRHEIPVPYRRLIDWYDEFCSKGPSAVQDSILALRGLGKEIWRDEDPDDYVRRLRE